MDLRVGVGVFVGVSMFVSYRVIVWILTVPAPPPCSSASSSPHYHSPPRAHSTISMTSSGSSTPPAVGRSQSMLTHPERYMRRTPFMDPHQEALEMVDPLVSLRSQAGGASEGTYV